MRKRVSIADVAITFVMLLVLLVMLLPFVYIVSASVSEPRDVYTNPAFLLPKNLNFSTYAMLFKVPWVLVGYRNSILYTVGGTLINVVVTFCAAFALSKRNLFGKRVVQFFIVLTMFISGGMIPSFLIVKWTGILHTPWAVMLPGAVSTYNLLITRTFLQTNIPDELHDAAEIDGAHEYSFFWNVALPLSLPIIAIITLFYASSHWNSYFNALLYLKDRNQYPLALFLRELLMQESADMLHGMLGDMASERAEFTLTLKYAIMVAAMVPMLIVMPFVQKFFVKGVMIGALKE